MKLLDSIIDSMDMSLSKLQETVKDRDTWHAAVHGVTKNQMTDRLNNNKNTGLLNHKTKQVWLATKPCSRIMRHDLKQ